MNEWREMAKEMLTVGCKIIENNTSDAVFNYEEGKYEEISVIYEGLCNFIPITRDRTYMLNEGVELIDQDAEKIILYVDDENKKLDYKDKIEINGDKYGIIRIEDVKDGLIDVIYTVYIKKEV